MFDFCHLTTAPVVEYLQCQSLVMFSSCYTSAGLKKWVEVGNSGVFRPEMLLPMGLPENVSVIAWGLSLERLLLCCGDIDCLQSQECTCLD